MIKDTENENEDKIENSFTSETASANRFVNFFYYWTNLVRGTLLILTFCKFLFRNWLLSETVFLYTSKKANKLPLTKPKW